MFSEGKSATIFCHQVAAWVPDMFCIIYLVKSHKIANTSATTEAREKISTDLESVEFFDAFLTKFENYQILLNEISHNYLMTTKLFTDERASLCFDFNRQISLPLTPLKWRHDIHKNDNQ